MDHNENPQTYTVFEGHQLIERQASLENAALSAKKSLDKGSGAAVLIFNDASGATLDLDLSGSTKAAASRLRVFSVAPSSGEARGPGRPRLGVIAREVSLLPQHWEWLATQSGGASAALRRLVEDAKKNFAAKGTLKAAQERTYKFLSVIAGDLPLYEDALRALYRKNEKVFGECMSSWPSDVRAHAKRLARPVFAES